MGCLNGSSGVLRTLIEPRTRQPSCVCRKRSPNWTFSQRIDAALSYTICRGTSIISEGLSCSADGDTRDCLLRRNRTNRTKKNSSVFNPVFLTSGSSCDNNLGHYCTEFVTLELRVLSAGEGLLRGPFVCRKRSLIRCSEW